MPAIRAIPPFAREMEQRRFTAAYSHIDAHNDTLTMPRYAYHDRPSGVVP